jgi:hypothetical protein
MNKTQQLIVKKEANDYFFALQRTIVKHEGLQRDEVKGFHLRLDERYQIKEDLEIYLTHDPVTSSLLLSFWSVNDFTMRDHYNLTPHPKLENFYLVEQVEEIFLQALLDNNFCANFSITGQNYSKTRDW